MSDEQHKIDIEDDGSGADKGTSVALGLCARAPRALAWAWIACALGLALAPLLPSPQLAWTFALAPLGACLRFRREPRFVLSPEGLGLWQDGRRVLVPWTQLEGTPRERRELFVDYLEVARKDAPLLLLCLRGLSTQERSSLRDRCVAACAHADPDEPQRRATQDRTAAADVASATSLAIPAPHSSRRMAPESSIHEVAADTRGPA